MAFCWDLSLSPTSTQFTSNGKVTSITFHRLTPWYKLKRNICKPPLTHLTSWEERLGAQLYFCQDNLFNSKKNFHVFLVE
jgi:hypothetical protein